MRDLTPFLNLLAAYQLKARRLQRIADYMGPDVNIMYQSAEAFYEMMPIVDRINYLCGFIRSLNT